MKALNAAVCSLIFGSVLVSAHRPGLWELTRNSAGVRICTYFVTVASRLRPPGKAAAAPHALPA